MPALIIILNLSFRDVLSDIPHDAGAIFVYVLFALFAGFIWAGSRGSSRGPTSRS